MGIAPCKRPWPGRPRRSSSSSCYSSAGERRRCLECGKTKDTPSLGGSLQNAALPAPRIREEQLRIETQLCPPKLCLLPAAQFAQLPRPQTPSTPRQPRPGGRKRGLKSPSPPGTGGRVPLAPPAAIDSARSRRGVTAHFVGQLGFTIACSRGNLIQNNRLFFWGANQCILIPACASLAAPFSTPSLFYFHFPAPAAPGICGAIARIQPELWGRGALWDCSGGSGTGTLLRVLSACFRPPLAAAPNIICCTEV